MLRVAKVRLDVTDIENREFPSGNFDGSVRSCLFFALSRTDKKHMPFGFRAEFRKIPKEGALTCELPADRKICEIRGIKNNQPAHSLILRKESIPVFLRP